MNTFILVHKTYCSHGKNTGGAMASKFSKKEGSLQTSLGFYLTGETTHENSISDCGLTEYNTVMIEPGAEE